MLMAVIQDGICGPQNPAIRNPPLHGRTGALAVNSRIMCLKRGEQI